jgi:hypothetical protein
MDHDIVLLHKHFDAGHLEMVKSQMAELGAPTIRAIWDECSGFWLAIEGCHRLRACVELGVEPIIEEIEYSADDLESYVNADMGLDMEDERTLGDLITMMLSQIAYNRTVTFEDLQKLAVSA